MAKIERMSGRKIQCLSERHNQNERKDDASDKRCDRKLRPLAFGHGDLGDGSLMFRVLIYFIPLLLIYTDTH